MKKILQRVILFVMCASVAAMAYAATVPNVLSQLPYSYSGSNFPAWQINQDFAYTLSYTDSSVAAITPQTWAVTTASGVAALGGNYAVNTTSAAITMTLPTPTNASPVNAMHFLDALNTFSSNNLTVSASGVANMNGLSGASAVLTTATSGAVVDCVYLNSAIGYNCNAR